MIKRFVKSPLRWCLFSIYILGLCNVTFLCDDFVLVFENMFLNNSILCLTSLNKDICAVPLEPASVCLHSS